ncbi:hypothetical protein J4406_02925 [Candidatus Woesearchaeota archaeon]|nr:hypothetical protein [Candidatus Woesearchaeota archaeon]
MSDEFIDERESFEDEFSEEELEEMDPEMQGFLMGWKKAGRYSKKERHSDDFDEEY